MPIESDRLSPKEMPFKYEIGFTLQKLKIMGFFRLLAYYKLARHTIQSMVAGLTWPLPLEDNQFSNL